MRPLLRWFIAATYNEENELNDLLYHVKPLVNGYVIADDWSTDGTRKIIEDWFSRELDFHYIVLPHTGLPETVKHEAKELVPDGAWIIMLDADERFSEYTKRQIFDFFRKGDYRDVDYVYFNQVELLDGQAVRNFQKAKLFKKEAIKFPLNNIHADDQFEGRGIYKEDWTVLHRKTTTKQITREQEYLKTYKRLLDEGKIDEGRYNWLRGLHHFVRE
jgi:glycosyltransferase involved in cell wall biosynthesis